MWITYVDFSSFPGLFEGIQVVNQKGKLKSSLVFDEFPTIYLTHIAHYKGGDVDCCWA